MGGILIDGSFSRQEVNDLLSIINVYVSLHRSEGFGLGMAEAMFLGKPVIVTNFSANTDFMHSENSLPVDYHLREVSLDDHKYQQHFQEFCEPGQLWAEPDITQAATYMRSLYENPEHGLEIGKRATEYMRQEYSVVRFVNNIEGQLGDVDSLHNIPLEKHIEILQVKVQCFIHRFNRPFNHAIGWHRPEVAQDGVTCQWMAAEQAVLFLHLNIVGNTIIQIEVHDAASNSIRYQPGMMEILRVADGAIDQIKAPSDSDQPVPKTGVSKVT